MPGRYKESARKLYKIAQSQQGFFITKQATRAGFTGANSPAPCPRRKLDSLLEQMLWLMLYRDGYSRFLRNR